MAVQICRAMIVPGGGVERKTRRPQDSRSMPFHLPRGRQFEVCAIGTGCLIAPFGDLVAEHPLFNPADGQQVVKRSEQPVPHAIMALAGKARIVADGNFGHSEPFDLEQCRQEAMHAFEKFEASDALALESAVSAPGIADLLTRQFGPDPVGDARGADAYETVAFAARMDARAANTIELFQGIEKSRQVFRVILQIGVERDEVLPARSLQAGPTCGRLAAVESKTLHPDARVACRKFFEDLPGVVLAAIIGNNDFVSQVEPVHGLADRRDERAQISFFIVTRDDEAEGWGGHGSMLRLNSQIALHVKRNRRWNQIDRGKSASKRHFSSCHRTAPAHRIPGPRYQGPCRHESAAKESLSRAARCAAVWARTGTDPSRPVEDGSVSGNGCRSRCSVP